jgi:hypothetical protein
MSGSARAEVETLKMFRACLWKFGEIANVAMAGADGDMQRTLQWLENEQLTHWQGEIRKATERVARAKEALRMKQLFKDSSGKKPSAVDEQKALQKALKHEEFVQQKLIATKQHSKRLQREIQIYKGTVQRFATAVQADIPAAAARLGNLVAVLESYAAEGPATMATSQLSGSGATPTTNDFADSMARAEGGEAGALPIAAADLRRKAPTEREREVALAKGVMEGKWIVGLVRPEQRESLKTVVGEGTAAGESDKIVLGSGVSGGRRIFLERLTPCAVGDSGWYAASMDAGVARGEWEAVEMGKVMKERPDLREILLLPVASVVVMGEKGVEAVFDLRDRRIWPVG